MTSWDVGCWLNSGSRTEGDLNSDPYSRGVDFCASSASFTLSLYFFSTNQFLAAASAVRLNSNSGFFGLKQLDSTIFSITSIRFFGQFDLGSVGGDDETCERVF